MLCFLGSSFQDFSNPVFQYSRISSTAPQSGVSLQGACKAGEKLVNYSGWGGCPPHPPSPWSRRLLWERRWSHRGSDIQELSTCWEVMYSTVPESPLHFKIWSLLWFRNIFCLFNRNYSKIRSWWELCVLYCTVPEDNVPFWLVWVPSSWGNSPWYHRWLVTGIISNP